MLDHQKIKDLARQARIWALKATTQAKSGHPGGSLSCADILAVLYGKILHHDPQNPHWEDRDRFILSKGHGVPALYAILGLVGYYPVEEIMTLRQLDSPFQGHPDRRKLPLLEASTGSLGQGLSIGIGMALAARLKGKAYHTYVLLGDGECNEGQVWEAAMFAGYHQLGNLTVIVDFNFFQLDDATERILDLEPFDEKWKAFRWQTIRVNGHDIETLEHALLAARDTHYPTVVIAETIKGKGVSFLEGNNEYHGKALTPEQLKEALKELEENHGGA